LAQLTLAQRPRVVDIDDLLLLGFGPRLGQALRELRSKLAPASGPATAAVQP
jgi:ABC-type hemin transport system substrate-binding protein